jgi:DNA-binding response OmpR family regulator
VICISGMVEQDKVSELKDSGADDFLQKPFKIEDLLDRACEMLDMEKAGAHI